MEKNNQALTRNTQSGEGKRIEKKEKRMERREGRVGNMQGTQEHDDMARAIASVVGKRKKRPGLELGWKREGEDTMAAFPHPQEAPLIPGSPPLPWPPKIPSLLFCLWP